MRLKLLVVLLILGIHVSEGGKILKKLTKELKKVIDGAKFEDFISMISADVAENSDNIAEHSDNIAENSDNIAKNSDNITKNANINIDVANNDAAIVSLLEGVANNVLNITNLKTDVAVNAANIEKNAMDIADHLPVALDSILVSTGYPHNSATQTSEVINTDNSSLTCKDLEEYPLQVRGAVGSNMASLPVICGGYDSGSNTFLTQCYLMESGKWNLFANLAQGRYAAAGISHAQSFYIFGGSNSGGRLSSTEIITGQGVSAGPVMPEAVYHHAIASVDETTSILTGGILTSGPIANTWLFSHVSNQFQAGPSLLTGRSGHASSTVQDRVTMENIVAVVGGYGGGALDTTELLFNGESTWQQGPQMPKTLEGSRAVQIGGDLYTVGGYSYDGSGDQTAIHRMSCWSRSCTWTTMTQELKVARRLSVLIPIPKSFCVPV